MKKLIAGLILIFAFVSMQGQNSFKYQINAKGGINVTKKSTAADDIDSLKISGGSLMVYQGATAISTGGIQASDTASMLSPYAQDYEVAALENSVYDTIEISSVVPMLVDTIPLFVFGAGSGATSDTALFNNSRYAGCFYNEGSDTLAVTQLMGILREGTGTETISVQISWHATFLSGSATNLNSSALAITSLTTGTTDTSFANSKIPPNVFVWCTLSGASANNKPTFLSVTISGYKIPTY